MDGSPSQAQADARRRLTVAVESARTGEPTGELARAFLGRPVGEVVDEIEARLRRALTRQASTDEALEAVGEAAQALDAVGLCEDAARLYLVAALALEGRPVGPTMQDMRLVAIMLASSVAEDTDAAQESAEGFAALFGYALGGESDAVVASVANARRNGIADLGRNLRERLMREGRVVAVGHCRRCGCGVRLDEGLRCSVCGKETRRPDFVVASEVEAALSCLG